MTRYVDRGEGCPKCSSRDLKLLGAEAIGFEYSELYRCRGCGYEFTDVFEYRYSYDEEGGGDEPNGNHGAAERLA